MTNPIFSQLPVLKGTIVILHSSELISFLDLIPFPCFIAVDRRIDKLNSAAKELGLQQEGLNVHLGDELVRFMNEIHNASETKIITEHKLIINNKERFFNVIAEPVAADGEQNITLVFLEEVTHLIESSNDLAESLIETEIANKNLARTIVILSVLTRFGAELIKSTSFEEAVSILNKGISNAKIFEKYWIIIKDQPLPDDIYPQIRNSINEMLKSEGTQKTTLPKPYMSLPITGREKFYGILCGKYFHNEIQDITIDLKPFTAMTAFILDNIELYKELLISLKDLSLRNQIAKALQESHSIGKIESQLEHLLKDEFKIRWLRIVRNGTNCECSEDMKKLIENAFQGFIAEEVFDDAAGFCIPIKLSEPLKMQHQVHSVIAILSDRKEQLSIPEKELLISISDLVSISMSTIQIYDDLRAHNVAVEYLNEELNKTIVELKSANEMKNRFVSTVSHEFRTPLTAISSYVQTLLAAGGSLDSETMNSFLSVISDETDRLTRLINQVLDLSRIQARDRPLNSIPISIRKLSELVMKVLKPVADKKGVCLELIDGVSEGKVFGDEDALRQVLFNLVGNAIRYTLPGGKIEIQVEEDKKFVYTAVRDTGIGIPKESLDAIFSEFYTVSQTRAALIRSEAVSEELSEEGTGLGLSIAKAIIERHGGRISVTSNVGVGSEFIVTLLRRASVDSKKAADSGGKK